MNDEEINEILSLIKHARQAIDDLEAMIQDFQACKSETSKKYLGAAILKQSSQLKQTAGASKQG